MRALPAAAWLDTLDVELAHQRHSGTWWKYRAHSFRCAPRSQASPPIPERFICVSSARATRLCVIRGNTMPFVITDPCIGTKDTACVDVCPVDCIHPGKGEAEFAAATMLYIHPEECIDCGACVPVCPVTAIYDSVDAVPGSQKALTEANAIYRNGHAEAMAAAEAIVKAHIEAHPELMNLAPTDRQAAH
jgi:NAD-dependent dihydropyrimidine dehydrogenase PreA subunit